MKPLLILLFSLCALCTAHAQIGLTEAQLRAKYGAPMKDAAVPALDGARVLTFSKSQIRILAAVHKGTVALMYYQREDGGKLDRTLSEAILPANALPGTRWSYYEGEGIRGWATEPGHARGALLQPDGALLVAVPSFLRLWLAARVGELRNL